MAGKLTITYNKECYCPGDELIAAIDIQFHEPIIDDHKVVVKLKAIEKVKTKENPQSKS